MNNYIKEVSANVRLEEGSRVIEQLLIACYLKPGISTKELARKTMLPVPVATAIKKELIKAGALRQTRGVRCTSTGKTYITQEMGYDGLDEGLYRKVLGNKAVKGGEPTDLSVILDEYLQSRPQVDVQLDQAKCTAETSLRRAILSLRDYVLVGKRVLCVGDDDLVSVSLGLLLKHLFPHARQPKATIDVVDIDERFLRYIQNVADQEGLPITCHHLDLRQPLPAQLNGRYDCFFTDPPYTLQGMTLFVSRGISALKKEKGLPIYLSFAHKPPHFSLSMQTEFVRMGLMVREVIPHFNAYEGAQMIGNRGQMIVLQTTEHTSPLLATAYAGALYTGEVKRTVRTYCCTQCDESIVVGVQGEYATIEQLKSRGCPNCDNDTFRMRGKRTV